MPGSSGGWILKNSSIPITKKPNLNLVLRAKLAKGSKRKIKKVNWDQILIFRSQPLGTTRYSPWRIKFE
jgi:hypothetical protein